MSARFSNVEILYESEWNVGVENLAKAGEISR